MTELRHYKKTDAATILGHSLPDGMHPNTVGKYAKIHPECIVKRLDVSKGLVVDIDDLAAKMAADNPEMYGALERGTLDAATSYWTSSLFAYRVYEVTKYTISNLPLGSGSGYAAATKEAWDALPEEFKEICNTWAQTKAVDVTVAAMMAEDAQNVLTFKEYVEFIEFPPEEIAKLKAKAKEEWESWVDQQEAAGLPMRELYEYILDKRSELIK